VRAIVDVLHASDDGCHTRAMLDGLAAAQALFGVPVVGGHTGYCAAGPSLCAAVVGKARRLITSFDARPGQQVLACVDLRGGFRGDSLHFDAVSNRKPAEVRAQLELLPQLAEAGLVGAGKDISMAGLCGTLLMLCESSRCGAVLDLAALPLPEVAGANRLRWLQAFPSFGFVLAVEPEASGEVSARFAALGVAATVVAELAAGSAVELRDGAQRERYWDWRREPLLGFPGGGDA
jgi:selenophosphate synthetase-related protein